MPVKLKFASKRFLRNLEEVLYGINTKCDINKELQTDYAAGYDCANSDSFSGTPYSMEIESNKIEDIEGIPDSANPDKLKYNIDYSLLENLKTIDNLPFAEIQNINADTCSKDGEFNITAILNKKGNLKSSYSNVRIRFAVPETEGLCKMSIKDKNMSMICQNAENFYITQVFIERQAIQDSKGNELFFIESFINPEQFACEIGANLNATNLEDDTNYRTKTFRKNNSGLSGGVIAAIVISVVVVVAIAAILAIYSRKNCKENNNKNKGFESTISGLASPEMQNNFN